MGYALAGVPREEHRGANSGGSGEIVGDKRGKKKPSRSDRHLAIYRKDL